MTHDQIYTCKTSLGEAQAQRHLSSFLFHCKEQVLRQLPQQIAEEHAESYRIVATDPLIQKVLQRARPPSPWYSEYLADTKNSAQRRTAVVVCSAVAVKNILEGQIFSKSGFLPWDRETRNSKITIYRGKVG